MKDKFISMPQIIKDISILYELSLATGRSLFLEENAEYFLKTLMSRKGFGYAAVWIKEKHLWGSGAGEKLRRVYANPLYNASVEALPESHRIFSPLEDKRPLSVSSHSEDFPQYITEKHIREGTFIIFPLKDWGVLKLYSSKENLNPDLSSLNQLAAVIEKFATSLEGALAYGLLNQEMRRKEAIEQELLITQEGLEEQVRERTLELEKANSYLLSLQEMVPKIMNRLQTEELLQQIVARAGELLGTEDGFISILNRETGEFKERAVLGLYKEHNWHTLNEKMARIVEKSRKYFVLKQFETAVNSRSPGNSIYLPLKSRRDVVGILGLTFQIRKRSLTDAEMELALGFAELASIALDNAELYREAQTELLQRKKAQRSLQQSEAKLRALLDAIPDEMFRMDAAGRLLEVKSSKNGLFTEAAAESWIGDFLDKRKTDILLSIFRKSLITEETEICELELLQEGRGIWEIRFVADGDKEAVGIARNITEKKNLEARLHRMSFTDSLTELANRNYFQQQMEAWQENEKAATGIFICDLNGLKFVNDTLGHDSGDDLLRSAAGIIRKTFSEPNRVARIGGDEFAIIVGGKDSADYWGLKEELIRNIDDYNKDKLRLPLSMAIGYAYSFDSTLSPSEIFRQADDDMYRNKERERKKSHDLIVRHLMQTMEKKEYGGKKHLLRLQKISALFAERLNLETQRKQILQNLAYYHDLGKIGISEEILLKKGRLNLKEKKEAEKHAEIGARIASFSEELKSIADLILKHHEWWNGEGYPLGLSGEEIPLECRMLAIVDAFDIMTHDQIYRDKMSKEEALTEIKACAGTQFDPRLADIFIRMVEN